MKRFLLLAALGVCYLAGQLTPIDTTTLRRPPRWLQLASGVPLEATYTPTPIQSIQQVTASFSGATTKTVTLSPSVIAGNSLLIFQGHLSGDGSSGQVSATSFAYATITNGTTVTATLPATSSAAIWQGVLVEYLGIFVKSQGCGTIAIAFNAGSNTATIGSVNTAKTVVAFTGWNIGTNPMVFDSVSNVSSQITPRVALTNATTITATLAVQSAPTDTRTVGYCYVEFK